jgi:hypothetical protein
MMVSAVTDQYTASQGAQESDDVVASRISTEIAALGAPHQGLLSSEAAAQPPE